MLVARGAASSPQAGSEKALQEMGPEGFKLHQAAGTHAGSMLIGGQFPFCFPQDAAHSRDAQHEPGRVCPEEGAGSGELQHPHGQRVAPSCATTLTPPGT